MNPASASTSASASASASHGFSLRGLAGHRVPSLHESQEFATAHSALTKVLGQVVAASSAADLAVCMLQSLKDSHLDLLPVFERFGSSALLQTMPREAWRVLQEYARLVNGGRGVEWLTLPLPDPEHSRRLGKRHGAEALAINGARNDVAEMVENISLELKDLCHLNLHVPNSVRRLDLGRLRFQSSLPPSLHIHGPLIGGLDLCAPKGTKVLARMTGGYAQREKSTVKFMLPDGTLELMRHTMRGVIYSHQPWAFEDEEVETGVRAGKIAHDLNLNGDAANDGAKPYVCVHLAMLWLCDRADYHEAKALAIKAEREPEKFSFESYKSEQSLKARLDQNEERRGDITLAKVNGHVPCDIYATSRMADMLAGKLRQLKPGQSRQYLSNSPNHDFAVDVHLEEVKAPDGATSLKYVVHLYDPNKSAMDMRLVVDDPLDLEGALEDWFDKIGPYFPGDARIALLYDVSPHSKAVETPEIWASEADQASGAFLAAALESGSPEMVRFAIECIEGIAPHIGPAQAEARLRAMTVVHDEVLPALHKAIRAPNRQDVFSAVEVAQYVMCIRAIPAYVLSEQAKCRLLAAVHQGRSIIRAALNSFIPACVPSTLVESLLSPLDPPPPGDLSRESRIRVLMGFDERGEPAMHAKAKEPDHFSPDPGAAPLPPQSLSQASGEELTENLRVLLNSRLLDSLAGSDDPITKYMRELIGQHQQGNLTDDEMAMICRAEFEGKTAGSCALGGGADVAIQLLVALADDEVYEDDEKMRVLSWLDIDVKQAIKQNRAAMEALQASFRVREPPGEQVHAD